MNISSSPKYDWMLAQVASGFTTVLGKEDEALWNSGKFGVNVNQDLSMIKSVIIGEQLEQVDDPIAYLKDVKAKYPSADIHITVPNEHSWNPEYKPFQNPKHKRHYDCDTLIKDLEEAGLKYDIKYLDYNGWAFWVVKAR